MRHFPFLAAVLCLLGAAFNISVYSDTGSSIALASSVITAGSFLLIALMITR